MNRPAKVTHTTLKSMARIAIWVALGWAQLATAQSPEQAPDPDTLKTLEREQADARAKARALTEERQALLAEISQLKQELIKTAGEAETYESEARTIDGRLTELEQERARLIGEITQNRSALTQFLAALQRIEASPPPTVIGQATSSVEAVQAARLIAAISDAIQDKTDILNTQLQALRGKRVEIRQTQGQLDDREISLAQKLSEIRALVAQKQTKEKVIASETDAIRRRADQLAREADTLRDLIATFERAARGIEPRIKPGLDPRRDGALIPQSPDDIAPRLKPPPRNLSQAAPLQAELPPLPDTLRFSDARGRLRAPVPGRITQNFSQDHKGLTVSARRKAPVIAPYSGRVEFAGPFKNYDNVVILNVGDGYFILLTGLGETYTSTGDIISAGTPLGTLPNSGNKTADLYIEFRKNGTPINPKPWLGTAFARAG